MSMTINMATAGIYSFKSIFNTAKTIAPKNKTIFKTSRNLLAPVIDFCVLSASLVQELSYHLQSSCFGSLQIIIHNYGIEFRSET